MATETTYTHARAHLASLCDNVAANREVVVIHRRRAEDVALVSAAELRSLLETAHLLRSPKNARRLIRTLGRAQSATGRKEPVSRLRRSPGLTSKA